MKVREGQGEIKFTQAQIEKAEQVAKTRGMDSYLLLRLWGRRGLRVSETLRITKSDIRDKGVWIWQKGGERVLKILPPELYEELSGYSKKLKSDLVFPITRQTAYNWSQSIAREAGLDNWQRVHPHRWRHFFRDLPRSETRKGPLEGKEPDGSQGSPGDSGLRGQSQPRRGVGGIVKLDVNSHRRIWLPGIIAVFLLYHAYGIFSGIYSDLTIVSSDQAIIVGVLEALIAPVFILIFLWRTLVWWHNRPWTPKHVFDDPGILD